MRGKLLCLVLGVAIGFAAGALMAKGNKGCILQSAGKIFCPEDNAAYLESVYKDTFACIDFFVHPKTGIPYDVSDYRKPTSTSNIGLYMASVAVAAETGLIEKAEAVAKITKTFDSLEKIDKWHGFPITWVNVETLQREFEESFSYADHVGNLLSSLLVVASVFPQEFSARVDAYIKPMDFSVTYDEATGFVKGGYHLGKKDFDVEQPWGKWYYNILASDTISFSLAGLALGQFPDRQWEKLNRDVNPWGKTDKEIMKILGTKTTPYFAPGVEGGGLFMQYISGIFINFDGTPIGTSGANFAYAQKKLSEANGILPFFGVSACEAPDGNSYIGWGSMDKKIVTPHAAVLAVKWMPKDVIANLKALEKNNVRPLYKDAKTGKEYKFGFTDSYDTKTKIASKKYLILDQSMLFLSLANFLHEDIVRKKFAAHSLGATMNAKMRELDKKYGVKDFKKLIEAEPVSAAAI